MYTKNMSKKYLDSKGLSYLWQKIKSEISLNPGPQGEQGSVLYNASTYSDYITNGYESSMRVNDLILDNGGSVFSRRGNVYRIIDINDDTAGEFESNEIFVQTNFNDIDENKKFIIVSKVPNEPTDGGYTYWAMSNSQSTKSDCAAIQLSNDDIHEKEGVIYLDKMLSNSVDLNNLYFKLQRNPSWNGATYTDKARIIALNSNYNENKVNSSDCLYFGASTDNTTRLNSVINNRNAVFEIDENTGYNKPYLLGSKFSSSDPLVLEGLQKYLGVYNEDNAPSNVKSWKCYANIKNNLNKQEVLFLVEDNVSVYNPTSPKVVIDEEPVTNLLGYKGEPGKDGDVPYTGSNGNWFIAGVDTGVKAQGEDGLSSLSYIVATCDEHVIAKYYNEDMRIGDMVVDNGEVDEGRRGNMYRIINIIKNPDLSKYNAQYPPSNPAIIIDKNIVCNLKGDTINGKYIYDYILNSYSFGYQREIIENIKSRRLYEEEKQFLYETYGVNWEYVNLDNKVQEGLKGKLYLNEVDYIDEISDIKYVDLSIGGTLFNCDSVIIPEDDYSIYEFTYKYLSGIEGTNAFAEGDATLAKGNSSHAEGEWNTAYGDYSHSEGEYTTAQGQASHAEGEDTLAIGDVSHAEGARTLAVGDYSHTEGFDTVAQNAYEHSQGTYNVSNKETDTFGDKNTIFSIGVGANELDRKNALEVLQNGNVYINGVGDYDGTNALRESYITGKIAKPLQEAASNANARGYVFDETKNTFIEGENHEWLNCEPIPYKVHKLSDEEKEILDFFRSIGIEYEYCINCTDNTIQSIMYSGNKVNLKESQIKECSGSIGVDGNIIIQTESTGALYNYIELKFFNLELYDGNGDQITLNNDTEYYFNYPDVGLASHIESSGSIGIGDYSHVEGSNSVSIGSFSHAEGHSTTAKGYYSHSEGIDTISLGHASHVEGKDTISKGMCSHAEGSGSIGIGNYSHAEGNGTTASGIASHAEGSETVASGNYSHSEGSDTGADGDYSHVEGSGSIGIGACSHAEGCCTRTEGANSHAEGLGSYTSGEDSHAEGLSTIAEGVASHTEGCNTHAERYAAHAEGSETVASGIASHAEGSGSIGIGEFSHAEGSGTIGIGKCSHAEGIASNASGDYSHAEGSYTQTGASGAHAEGGSTVASGVCSHAEGSDTKAVGVSSHAEGEGTIANNTAEHVEGRYNMPHSNTISSIGIGTAGNSRCNALEVINNGDLYIKGIGDYVGGTNGDPHEMENVLSLQNVISNIQEGVGSVAESQITYNGSNNISVNNGVISAKGYSYDIETETLTVPGTLKLLSTEYDSWIRMNFADFATNSITFGIENSSINLSNTPIVSNSNITTEGTIRAKQGFYETSDIRKKNVIDELPLDKAYELINNCQSIIYTLKDNTDKQQIGLIAQEVQQYFPEVVSEDKDGYLSLDYAKLTSVIFRVLKDVIDRLNKLENK